MMAAEMKGRREKNKERQAMLEEMRAREAAEEAEKKKAAEAAAATKGDATSTK